MERIGVRELRQNASRWLERVAAGESFEVTVRGRPVALLSPRREASARDRLLATGELIPARGDLLTVRPLAPQPGRRSLNKILQEMREEEDG